MESFLREAGFQDNSDNSSDQDESYNDALEIDCDEINSLPRYLVPIN